MVGDSPFMRLVHVLESIQLPNRVGSPSSAASEIPMTPAFLTPSVMQDMQVGAWFPVCVGLVLFARQLTDLFSVKYVFQSPFESKAAGTQSLSQDVQPVCDYVNSFSVCVRCFYTISLP